MRKSAFSVYAEAKPSDVDELKSFKKKLVDQNGKQNHKPFQNEWENKKNLKSKKANGNHLFSSTLKDQNLNGILKRKNEKTMSKKAQKKFAKLTSENISESINLFSAENVTNQKKKLQQKLKELNNFHFHAVKSNSNPPILIKQDKSLKQKKTAEPIKPSKSKASANFAKICKNLTGFSESNEGEKFHSDFDSYDKEIDQEMFDSRKEAANLFKKIISPVTNKEFFSKYWEKEAMLIKRSQFNYYKSWFSCKEFDSILRNHNLEFTTNIDITTYIDQEKQKHNPEGKAYAPIVWDFFQQGCSIRLLNPQSYSRNIWKYLSLLQELFGTCVGSNVYLTPAGTQGFAPHYDDIEAFVLQLEGKKRWRVYKPLSENETLPRFSSQNFAQADLPDPIIDVVLEPGDCLYFPRGYPHQANALDDIHSLHITVSCYQMNSWGVYLSKLLPGAIEQAMTEDIEYRQGMPINYLMSHGVAYESDKKPSNDRVQFKDKVEKLVKKLVKYLPIDATADQMAKNYIHESLPPCFTDAEKSRSIHGHGEKWNEQKNRVENIAEMEPDTAIKLIRKNCLRLVVEEDSCLIYHNLDNSKVWKEKEPQFLECEVDAAPAIEFLIKSYPKYVTVDELPMETDEEKIVVASCLYDKGLLVTGEPLECVYEDNEDEDEDEDENEDENEEYGCHDEEEALGDEDEEVDEEEKDEDDEDENEEDVTGKIGEDDDDEEQTDQNGFNSEDYDQNGGELESESKSDSGEEF
jgi:bifunctional lysine-specific demethylase and histidyl-hydroxylase NO66